MPTISLRGTMMSSTVAFSRSRMLTSICWWRCGIIAPASATTVRNSSLLKEFEACCRGTPNRRSTPFASRFVAQTKGYSTQQQGRVDVGGGQREPLRMQGAESLGRHLAEDQQHQGERGGAEGNQEFAAQSQGDEAHQHRRRHIDDGAEQ